MAANRLARNVRVGATLYEVKRSGEPDGEHRWAETSFVHREIRFSVLCDELEVPNTFLHELIHAISEDRGMGMSEDSTKTLANGLTAVLQDLGWMPTRLKLADDP